MVRRWTPTAAAIRVGLEGATDALESQFNRAANTRKPAGVQRFKPIDYLAALDKDVRAVPSHSRF